MPPRGTSGRRVWPLTKHQIAVIDYHRWSGRDGKLSEREIYRRMKRDGYVVTTTQIRQYLGLVK